MKKVTYATLLMLMIGGHLQAQDAVTVVDYAITIPAGETKDYIDKTEDILNLVEIGE